MVLVEQRSMVKNWKCLQRITQANAGSHIFGLAEMFLFASADHLPGVWTGFAPRKNVVSLLHPSSQMVAFSLWKKWRINCIKIIHINFLWKRLWEKWHLDVFHLWYSLSVRKIEIKIQTQIQIWYNYKLQLHRLNLCSELCQALTHLKSNTDFSL